MDIHFCALARRLAAGLFGVALLAGCASQQPVLYPNATLNQRGKAAGDQAVKACMAQARSSGLSYSKGQLRGVGRGAVENGAAGGAGGAVAGAIYGDAARGAAAGAAGSVAAGLIAGLFHHHDNAPAPAYRRYVNRCLRDRGYEPVAWN